MPYIHAALQDHAESQVSLARMILGVPEAAEPDEEVEEENMNRAYEWFKRIGEENARKKGGFDAG